MKGKIYHKDENPITENLSSLSQKKDDAKDAEEKRKKEVTSIQKTLTNKMMNNTPNKPQDPITHNASPTTQVPNKAAQKDSKKAPVASLAQKKGEDG